MDGSTDYYAVLGVPPDATAPEITLAFRARAKELHPNLAKDKRAPRRFELLVLAHDVLSDPERRDEYDRDRTEYESEVDESSSRRRAWWRRSRAS
jgi:curved DNA-binding protein